MDTTKSKWWVGQRVHACAYGDGTVKAKHAVVFKCIEILFDRGITVSFSEDGREYTYHKFTTLFPIDTEPPRVKVKKRVEGWVNLYPDLHACGCMIAGPEVYETEHGADSGAHKWKRIGPAHHFVHEWEE